MSRGTPSEPGADPDGELIALSDWRRRIADLYAGIRAAPEAEIEAAWRRWVAEREALFREHPQSPLAAPERDGFRARHWDYDPALRFHVAIQRDRKAPHPDDPDGGLLLPVSDGATMGFDRIGWLEIPFSEGTRRLGLYWMAGYAGGLFLPFRDATNGAETYGAGRYLLDTAKSADLGIDAEGRLILDFNFAFQPSCAFDPRWACPLAPPENRLEIAIPAGERLG